MEVPKCKKPGCNNNVYTIKNGKWGKHCSLECKRSSPRGGKQYKEVAPKCKNEECDTHVLWDSGRRGWLIYCSKKCKNLHIGKQISATKKEINATRIKIDIRTVIKCCVYGCMNLAIINRHRKKPG